jgi:hypothetical protein
MAVRPPASEDCQPSAKIFSSVSVVGLRERRHRLAQVGCYRLNGIGQLVGVTHFSMSYDRVIQRREKRSHVQRSCPIQFHNQGSQNGHGCEHELVVDEDFFSEDE